jgi:hypothetical protein
MEAFASGARIAQGQAQLQLQQQAMQQKAMQDAVDAAEEKKAANFNRMFQMLQMGALERNRGAELALRQQELTARANDRTADNLRYQAEAERSKRRTDAYVDSLKNRGSSSADAVMAALLGGQAPPVDTPAPDAAVPMPQDVGDVAPSPADFNAPDLPTGDFSADQSPLLDAPPPPDGLFPGPDMGAEGPVMPPGPSGQPGVPDALLMQDIQGTGAPQGAEPPPSFATSDPGVSRWLRESEDIQTEIRTAAAARQEASARAAQIRALLPRVKDPAIAAKAAAEYGKLARQDAEQQATMQAKEGDLKAARLSAERAQRVQATMRTLAPLDNVLPAGDMARITKSLENAGDLPDTAPAVRQLADLAKYQEVRNALNMTEPSNGIATARELVRSYEAMQSDDVVQGRNAVRALGVLQKGLPTGEVGKDGMPVRKVPAATDQNYAAWSREVSSMESKAQPYFEAEARFRAARDGDIRRPEPKAETPAARAAQSAQPAPAPAPAEPTWSLITAADGTPVQSWWTAQKEKFSTGRKVFTGDRAVDSRPPLSLRTLDTETLKLAANGAVLYQRKGGGVTGNREEAELFSGYNPRTRMEQSDEPAEVGLANVELAKRLGYDPAMVPPGGDKAAMTDNKWTNTTVAEIIRAAAAEEVARRGVNPNPGTPAPVSDDLKKLYGAHGFAP